jgi:hypothetical protein
MADTPNPPAGNDPHKKSEFKDFKEIEKQPKVELKDFKEIEKHPKVEFEKDHKAEIKDIKEAKIEKLEKNEFKEHKDAKNEKSEKNEIKEHKEGAKNEQKEFKVEQKETLKVEQKDTLKIESPEKPIGKEKDGKEIVETGTGDPGSPVEQRLASLEQNVAGLQHFISTGQRPDLSRGALTGEPGGGAAAAPKGKTP